MSSRSAYTHRLEDAGIEDIVAEVLGGPSMKASARELIEHYGDVRGLLNAPPDEVARAARGVGISKAVRLKASLELSRRLLAPPEERPLINCPEAAAALLAPMATLEREEVWVILLDTRKRVIGVPVVYRGTLNSCSIRVAELFRDAIRVNADSIIVAHNHPSGDPTPSPQDIQVTQTLSSAGSLLGIELNDHIIMVPGDFLSLKREGHF